jgi:ribosomal protein S18 acetylase RimI-like enzyme
MTAASLLRNAPRDGLQALDLSRHLGGMAALIELCFNVTLDVGGRGLLREMQFLSHAGPLLNLLKWIPGANLYWTHGYVWLEGGQVVGCVSLQLAAPQATRWLIANVAVHPDHRRKGLALALTRAALDHIRSQGGTEALLQVDDDNAGAIALYQRLGFNQVQSQTNWRRSSQAALPEHSVSSLDVRLRSGAEWRGQLALAQRVRPYGLTWDSLLGPQTFRPTFWQAVETFFEGHATEHWVVTDSAETLVGTLLIHFGSWDGDRLTLLVHPDFVGQVERPLLVRGLRRLGRRPWHIRLEHPTHDETTTALLRELDFQPGRVLRWMMAEVK